MQNQVFFEETTNQSFIEDFVAGMFVILCAVLVTLNHDITCDYEENAYVLEYQRCFVEQDSDFQSLSNAIAKTHKEQAEELAIVRKALQQETVGSFLYYLVCEVRSNQMIALAEKQYGWEGGRLATVLEQEAHGPIGIMKSSARLMSIIAGMSLCLSPEF